MNTVGRLFEHYKAHQDELVRQYNGKYIVLTEDGVQGAYDTEAQGYYDAEEKFGLGNFLLQLCTPGTEAYTAHCYTPRVIF